MCREFAGQWMPWYDSVDSEEKDLEKRRAQRTDIRIQERQPGILIFRYFDQAYPEFSDRVLMIFLRARRPRPESIPIVFIARAYMRALRNTDSVLILGPTFSGSLHSLGKLIDQDREFGNGLVSYSARSGTVTSLHHKQAFLAGRASFVTFSSSTLDSETQSKGLRDTARALEISELSRVAILAEGESAYGEAAAETAGPNLAKQKNTRIRLFRFPRDISHLRNVYRDAEQAGRAPGKAPAPRSISRSRMSRPERTAYRFSRGRTVRSRRMRS